MIKPFAISRDQVKEFLNITNSTYDPSIDRYIPVVTNDLFRDNGICNQTFLITGECSTNTSTILTDVELKTTEWNCLEYGAVIYVSGEDKILLDFDEDAKTITIDTATSASATEQTLYIRNLPYGVKPTISKLILWKIKDGTVETNFGREAKSKSIGSVSVTYESPDSGEPDIDARFGYPSSLMRALATIRRPRFY